MKTIIVATDLSKDANNALEYAASLAKCINAKIVLYNSFMLPAHAANTLMPADGVEKMMASNRASLEYAALRISCLYDIKAEWDSNISNVEEELDKQVEKHKADLVVMGMRGNSFDQKLFGNTTTSVIRHAKYPVLVVPKNVSFKGIHKILFACDNNCKFALSTLKMLNEVASELKAEVLVLHVEKAKKMAQEEVLVGAGIHNEIETNLDGINHSYHDMDGCTVIKGIERGIEEFNADMLVMVPQKYGFWDSMTHKSKTCAMAARSSVPLLSIPNIK